MTDQVKLYLQQFSKSVEDVFQEFVKGALRSALLALTAAQDATACYAAHRCRRGTAKVLLGPYFTHGNAHRAVNCAFRFQWGRSPQSPPSPFHPLHACRGNAEL
jgi:hypothetical protein